MNSTTTGEEGAGGGGVVPYDRQALHFRQRVMWNRLLIYFISNVFNTRTNTTYSLKFDPNTTAPAFGMLRSVFSAMRASNERPFRLLIVIKSNNNRRAVSCTHPTPARLHCAVSNRYTSP